MSHLTPEREQRLAALWPFYESGELSQRRLARDAGVSRGTVAEIAAGRRSPTLCRDRAARREPSPARRAYCPDCGVKVIQPCLACRLRRMGRRRSILDDDGDEDLTIALKEEDHERYLEVRREKERELFAAMLDEAQAAAMADDDGEAPTAEELYAIDPDERARAEARRRRERKGGMT